MKEFIQLACLICLILIVSCNTNPKKSNNNQVTEISKKSDIKIEQSVSGKDSVIFEKKHTYQQLYSESEKRFEITGNLKHDSVTKKKDYNYKLGVDGNEARITLYYINNRIVTIENRKFDKNNNQLGYNMFDFDESNVCLSNTQRDYKEKMSYTNAMYWDTLIRFDIHCKIIDIDSSQKQQIIQLAKASLDSIMTHFPEFKYSFNWK